MTKNKLFSVKNSSSFSNCLLPEKNIIANFINLSERGKILNFYRINDILE